MPASDAAATPDLTRRETFAVWARDILRFGDTDRLGHVNNAVFSTFFETGRVAALYPAGRSIAPSGMTWVIARLALDYRAEILWPGEVEVGTCVLRLGRSSATFGQGLFVEGTCRATAESVIVMMDMKTRKSASMPEATRAALEALGASLSR